MQGYLSFFMRWITYHFDVYEVRPEKEPKKFVFENNISNTTTTKSCQKNWDQSVKCVEQP